MPNLAYALVDSTFEPFRAGELLVKPASEPWEKHAYFALRRSVFSDEQQLLAQDKDRHDFQAIAIVALAGNCGIADQVVGAVRIYQPEPGLWFGGRLCVAPAYRRHSMIGKALVNEAVSRAKELGCEIFRATVQAQNDYVAAMTGLNKAQSALDLAQIQEKRAKDLSEGKAIPLKDYQQAQAALVQAQNDARSAQTLLEAAQNKLHILGFGDDDITTLQQKGRLNPETTVFAPIGGTVVQRKAGPGQYVSTGASDPVYVIGDLSTVWLIAFVRESDADNVAVGQDLSFSVMALPGKVLNARVNYVAAAIDATSRRLLARATIDNTDKRLKPEMFANVTLYSKGDHPAVGVPKQALIYEGDQVRVWVARAEDKTIELRQIKPGLINGDLVEVAGNLKPGEQIVTKGSLFIDRAASGT